MAARVPARLSPAERAASPGAARAPAFGAAEGRRFGLTVGGAFLALAALLWWRDHPTRAGVAAGLGGALVVAALAIPARLGPVFRAWMRLGHAISRVTTPIFLGVVYFVIFAPVALVRRALGQSSLARAAKDGSYWISRLPTPGPRSDLTRQF